MRDVPIVPHKLAVAVNGPCGVNARTTGGAEFEVVRTHAGTS